MAMKPSSEVTYGPLTIYIRGSGTTVQQRRMLQRSLGDIVTKVGDFKKPLAHAYVSTRTREIVGQRYQYTGGRLSRSEVGVLPYVYTPTSVLTSEFGSYASGFNPHALSAAVAQAYDKLRGTVDLSIDLVQWRATVRMIAGYRRIVKDLVLTADALRLVVASYDRLERLRARETRRDRYRRYTRGMNRLANQVAAKRLEYAYGWAPLASTFHELATKAITPEPGLLVCKGFGKVELSSVNKQYSISADVPLIHHCTISDRAWVTAYYKPNATIMSELGKISSLNPVSIVYENTPFSFVFDWVYDVGGWIRSLETAFLHRNDFVSGYQTQTQRATVNTTIAGVSGLNATAISSGSFSRINAMATFNRTRFSRKLLGSAPIQVNPTKQFTFGVGRQLNAIALAKVVLFRADSIASRK